jgi:micrococcal nuclease
MRTLHAILVASALAYAASAAAMEFCSGYARHSCVTDGDTFWFEGERIRLVDIDTPEPGGRCVEERLLAARSAGRLAELLAGGFAIERTGVDYWGRTLARVSIGGVSVGQLMIAEGLARPWKGRRERDWCPAG